MANGLPRYYRAARNLEAMILERGLKVGDLLPSERELTKHFGMSRVTVRKALEELELAGMIDKRWGKGSAVARLPEPGSGRPCLGLVLWMLPGVSQHPALLEAMHGIHEVFPPNRYELKLVFITPHMFEAEDFPPALYGEGVDGLFVNVHEIPVPLMRELEASSFPVVFDNLPDYRPAVVMDFEDAAQRLTRHLLDLGHRRIGLISGDNEFLNRRIRTGYVEALRDAGLERDPALMVSGPYDEETGRRLTHEVLSESRPSALILGDDFMVLGALQAVRRLGLSCPRDVSVACFGGLYPSRFAEPALTVMHVPRREMGRQAARLLQRRMEGEDVHIREVLQLELIVRQSTGPVSQPSSVTH